MAPALAGPANRRLCRQAEWNRLGANRADEGTAVTTRIETATVAHRLAIIEAAARRPWFVAPTRAFAPEQLGQALVSALCSRIDDLIDHAQVDFLVDLATDDTVRGWAIVQHEVEEMVTGMTLSMVRDPSWMTAPLLEEAARRAAARGSVRLGADIHVDDDAQAAAARQAALAPEYHRIVCHLDGAPPSSSGPIIVRPATEEDRLFLVALSTECVPFMFCASRREEIELVRRRFFDVYAFADLTGDDEDLRVWVAWLDEVPAGAIQVRPRAGTAVDGGEEAYIFDISVSPAQWGGRVAVALVDHVIQEMRARGIKYLTGDISVDNARVEGLSRRFAFSPEQARWFRALGACMRAGA